VDDVIVVVPPEHRQLQRALAGLRVRYVVNDDPDVGMSGSIAVGVAALRADTEAALIALADEPHVPRDALRRVLGRYRDGGVRLVVPTYGGVRGHPVLLDRSVFDEVRSLSGDVGARSLTERDPGRVAFVELDVAKPIDVDTPADLANLRANRGSNVSLLDELMPQYDVRAVYRVEIRAPVETVYRALCETNLADAPISRALMALRTLGRRGEGSFRIGDLPERGTFFKLGARASREIVVGVMGRFWALTNNVCDGDRAAFQAPLAPGTAKAGWNFRIEPTASGATLFTETRVLCADDDSRRGFRRYWTIVGPFSGVIRKEALRLIRRRAQYMSSLSHTP
jgi:CTP:molybdopterin cytidylyltransferase MocA